MFDGLVLNPETAMKKVVALVAAMTLFSTALYAGGPVVVEDLVVVEEKPASSSGALIPLLLLALIGLVIASGDDEGPVPCI